MADKALIENYDQVRTSRGWSWKQMADNVRASDGALADDLAALEADKSTRAAKADKSTRAAKADKPERATSPAPEKRG